MYADIADIADGGNVDGGICENFRGGAEASGKVLSNPYSSKPERSKGLVGGDTKIIDLSYLQVVKSVRVREIQKYQLAE